MRAAWPPGPLGPVMGLGLQPSFLVPWNGRVVRNSLLCQCAPNPAGFV
jgi:hypothetical protein